ncbi:Antennal esterase CXE19 [Operophtera brumata]|uniref:Antennal esterase CXE19 n=1 Tax=Operophtera brumata TaxID=104452 RepID=A0A0L7L626_OPEBR|nr:Antennal esterase CXE19 [Operophtera brumata]
MSAHQLKTSKFGEDDTPTTTIRLPLEALGDAELVKRLLNLPVDQQPFWLINWQALADNRANPQTFAQRENSFLSVNQG